MISIIGLHYVSHLELLITDLNTKLETKEKENKQLRDDIEALSVRVEEKDDVIKVKQRY